MQGWRDSRFGCSLMGVSATGANGSSAQACCGRGTEVGSPHVAKAVVRAWQEDQQLTESLEARLGNLDTS